jgi:hypothetical protein
MGMGSNYSGKLIMPKLQVHVNGIPVWDVGHFLFKVRICSEIARKFMVWDS